MVKIDYSKCTEPEKCGRCLKVCSPQVFVIYPREKDAVNPKEWVVDSVWEEFCTQCGLCVRECPKNALALK